MFGAGKAHDLALRPTRTLITFVWVLGSGARLRQARGFRAVGVGGSWATPAPAGRRCRTKLELAARMMPLSSKVSASGSSSAGNSCWSIAVTTNPRISAREAVLKRRDAFLDGSRACSHLQDGPREEAAAGKRPAGKVVEVRVAHGEQLAKPRRRGQRRLDDLGSEDPLRFVHGRELEILLRAEVGVDAALAHAQTVREIADREPLEAVDGCQGNGLADDRFSPALAVRPLPACLNHG